MTNLKFIQRQSIIVWLYSTKNIRQLRKYGFVHYVSQRMKYAILYVNKEETTKILQELQGLFFVREVELSHRDEIDMTFEEAIEPFDINMVQDDFIIEETDESFFEMMRQSFKIEDSKKSAASDRSEEESSCE